MVVLQTLGSSDTPASPGWNLTKSAARDRIGGPVALLGVAAEGPHDAGDHVWGSFMPPEMVSLTLYATAASGRPLFAHGDVMEASGFPELAEVAECLGLPWHVGDRVRFEVVEGAGGTDGPASREPWPPSWVGSIGDAEPDLGEQAREVMRAELGS